MSPSAKAADAQEQTWVRAAQQGDASAYRHLVEAHHRRVYTLCLRLLNDPDEAEDATQEAFWRAYRALSRFDARRPFRPWLLSIAANHCLDRLRRRRTIPLADHAPSLHATDPDPEAELIAQEQRTLIASLVQQLPPVERALVLLRYWEGASYETIAQATGLTVSAVKSRLFRARRALAQAYQAVMEVSHA